MIGGGLDASSRMRYATGVRALAGLIVLVCLALPSAGFASECTAACGREAATCSERAETAVEDCRATVAERCAAACGCDAEPGAAAVACAQRCRVCKDMLREGAGLDCGQLETTRTSQCEQARTACESRCEE
jgi:hypothetical protein